MKRTVEEGKDEGRYVKREGLEGRKRIDMREKKKDNGKREKMEDKV